MVENNFEFPTVGIQDFPGRMSKVSALTYYLAKFSPKTA